MTLKEKLNLEALLISSKLFNNIMGYIMLYMDIMLLYGANTYLGYCYLKLLFQK